MIHPHGGGEEHERPEMCNKCGTLRFLCIDEVEATGAETVGKLEFNVRCHVSSKSAFKYYVRADNKTDVRIFGGVNTVFFGDFWQLRPTGQIALMSDPRAEKAQ